MIVLICGLIGAGKSTFAAANYDHVTELEQYLSKDRQIEETIKLHKEGKIVAHITCFPTKQEQIAFYRYSPEMVWINTSPEQAMKNVIRRGRSRDTNRLMDIEKANRRFCSSKLHSSYSWKVVNVAFPT